MFGGSQLLLLYGICVVVDQFDDEVEYIVGLFVLVWVVEVVFFNGVVFVVFQKCIEVLVEWVVCWQLQCLLCVDVVVGVKLGECFGICGGCLCQGYQFVVLLCGNIGFSVGYECGGQGVVFIRVLFFNYVDQV